MPEIQAIDSASLVGRMALDATSEAHRSPSGELPILRPEVIPTGYSGEQTQIYYTNGDSSAAQIKLNEILLAPPRAPQIKEFFRAIQKWEGYVLEVGSDAFRARLVSIVGEGPDQEAEIYLEEVDLDDRPLLQVGAVFYWTIGYLDRPSGRLRAAVLRFRRLPSWGKGELDAARAEAKKLENLEEKKILVVEDNEDTREILLNRLKGMGSYEVLFAANGKEAIEIASRSIPDLIIMDVNLPLMDGWETTQALRQMNWGKELPIIVLTAQAMERDEEKTLIAGYNDYIAKPIIDYATLKKKIEQFLK